MEKGAPYARGAPQVAVSLLWSQSTTHANGQARDEWFIYQGVHNGETGAEAWSGVRRKLTDLRPVRGQSGPASHPHPAVTEVAGATNGAPCKIMQHDIRLCSRIGTVYSS